MFTEEFDYDRAIEISKEEAREEGRIKNVRDMIMAGLTSLKAVRESDEMRPHGETDTETDTTKKNEPDGVYPCPAFFIASRKILEASLMLSSVAWVYIRSVTALSLWPKASETLAMSAPLVIATLAKVWRSLWG